MEGRQDSAGDVAGEVIKVVGFVPGLESDHLRDETEGFHEGSDEEILEEGGVRLFVFNGGSPVRDGEEEVGDLRGDGIETLADGHGQAEGLGVLQFVEDGENNLVGETVEEVVGGDDFSATGIHYHSDWLICWKKDKNIRRKKAKQSNVYIDICILLYIYLPWKDKGQS